MGEFYNDLKADRHERRAKLGVPCPRRLDKQTKLEPTILLPGQRCPADSEITMQRIMRRAGRLLDGVEHNAFPPALEA